MNVLNAGQVLSRLKLGQQGPKEIVVEAWVVVRRGDIVGVMSEHDSKDDSTQVYDDGTGISNYTVFDNE